MTPREQGRKMRNQVDGECSVENVHYQRYVIDEVRRGLKSIDDGRGIRHEQIRKKICSWATR